MNARDTRVQKNAMFAFLLIVAWCTMVVSHEVGHLLGGWFSGATLVDASVLPWQLPYSLHEPDPYPLVTLWSGPLFGAMVPGIVSLCVRALAVRFVADFCVLANGCYLATAYFSADHFLDTQRLLSAGAPAWTIWAFCLATISFGYPRFRADCIDMLTADASKSLPGAQSEP